MNILKTSTVETVNVNKIEKDTNTIVSSFNQIQKGIESNTNALQKLSTALTSYQEALNSSENNQIPGLDKIENILSAMDTVENFTSKLKNVGRGKMFPLIHC